MATIGRGACLDSNGNESLDTGRGAQRECVSISINLADLTKSIARRRIDLIGPLYIDIMKVCELTRRLGEAALILDDWIGHFRRPVQKWPQLGPLH